MKELSSLTPDVITKFIAGHYNLPVDEIVNDCRNRELVKVRHISMYFCRLFCGYSLEHIGRYFNRDHATVLHAYQSVRDQAQIYVSYRNEIEILENELACKVRYDREFERYKQYQTENV